MGLGVYARRDIQKGEAVSIFGQLHRITHKQAIALEKIKETSLIMFTRGVLGKRRREVERHRRKRVQREDWYYLGGPLELVNHSCKRYNAGWDFDELGADNEFTLEILNSVAAGEQLLVSYGKQFWRGTDEQCMCVDCEAKRQ